MKKVGGVWEWCSYRHCTTSTSQVSGGGGGQYANPCLPTVAECGQLFQFVSINPTITRTTPPGGKPGQLISDDGDGREKSLSVHTFTCEEGRKEGRKEELSCVTNIQVRKKKKEEEEEIDCGNTKGQHSIGY